jgi:2-polyprenyl-6-methoxyphenol hydroxylase-like FAD-dependent oxidoreductase
MPLDVLIVGGGIGGAVLAHLLSRAGKRCVVLERETRPAPIVRPEVLWPATVATLSSLLPARELHGSALLPLSGIEFHVDGQPVVRVTPDAFRRAGVQPWSSDPSRTRELLVESGGFELRRGVEVTEVLRQGARVVGVRARDVVTGVVTDLLAEWTVGDDGAHSRVRQACGIPLRSRMFPMDFLCAAVELPAGVSAAARVWFSIERGMLAMGLASFPQPRRRAVLLAPIRHKTLDDESRLKARWRRLLAANPLAAEIVGDLDFPGSFAAVRRPWGHAARYGAAGAFLIGDAAHPVSPAGGQGANMSVADAVALADALVRHPSDALRRYERRRRPANARSLFFTRAAAAVLLLPPSLTGRLAPAALRALRARPGGFENLLRSASLAFQG